MRLRIIALATALALPASAQSALERASALEKQGKLNEARDLYRQAAEDSRATRDQRSLAAALSGSGYISRQLGDSTMAIRDAGQAIKLRQTLGENTGQNVDFNTIGWAYQNMGNYPAALENYELALKFDRLLKDRAGEIARLNNIGGIYVLQGGYVTALEKYQAAMEIVNANSSQPWRPWGWKLTNLNIAIVYQRIGLEEQALVLYQQIAGRPQDMPQSEYAQLLVNEGVLYRHLGDPVKALELYHSAQSIYRTAHHIDGELGAWRSIGIAEAMDLNDDNGALKAFAESLNLSQKSSNNRGIVLANLYMGEVFRRLHQYKEAASHLHVALEVAQKVGLTEEQWKTLYALGRIAERTESTSAALEYYRKAISIIESVRAGLRITSLRTDFLADKRDVYDSLIALQAQQPNPSADELLGWMERSRARTLQDRVVARTPLQEATVALVQSHLRPDTVLIEFWMGAQDSLAVWITGGESGVARNVPAADIRTRVEQLLTAMQKDDERWKKASRELGAAILAGIPGRRHVIVVPDGPLNFPIEMLGVPGSDRLLVEQSDVTYLPSARLVAMPKPSGKTWLFPWNREMVAIGDPPVHSADALAEEEHWQPLPASAEEVRGIARVIPGRAEVHLGADARKAYLLNQRLEGLPLLHLSTHALVDLEHPERSRILLASDSPLTSDYLFQQEVNDLDLKNVGLVTVSACDTARGKIVAGEGAQAFSQSFLAAGASATITSMWKVADEPTARFMNQVYYSLGRGAAKAEALQAAKLQFLRSNSVLSNPRYWAAFVLHGDGWDPTTRVVPWSAVLLTIGAALAAIGLVLWRFVAPTVRKKEQRMAQRSP